MKMNSAAGSYFSCDSSRFHKLTNGCSTYFPEMRKHAAFEKGATLQGLAQRARETSLFVSYANLTYKYVCCKLSYVTELLGFCYFNLRLCFIYILVILMRQE